MPKKMTPKKLMFCKEFLVDLNGTAAAIRAGYSEKTANEQASRLLADVNIQKEIERLKAERVERIQVNSDEILRELVRLSQSDIRKVFDEDGALRPMAEWPDAIAACVASVEVDEIFEYEGSGDDRKRVHIGYTKKVKFWDKNKALDMLGRHMKLFSDDDGSKTAATILIQNGDIFKKL